MLAKLQLSAHSASRAAARAMRAFHQRMAPASAFEAAPTAENHVRARTTISETRTAPESTHAAAERFAWTNRLCGIVRAPNDLDSMDWLDSRCWWREVSPAELLANSVAEHRKYSRSAALDPPSSSTPFDGFASPVPVSISEHWSEPEPRICLS